MSQNPVSSERVIEYRVQRGDTLCRLAIKFNTDIWTLKRINRLISLEIFPDKILKIPVQSSYRDFREQSSQKSEKSSDSDSIDSRLLKFDAMLCVMDAKSAAITKKFVPIKGKVVVSPSVLMFDEKTKSDADVLDKQFKATDSARSNHVSLLFQLSLIKSVAAYKQANRLLYNRKRCLSNTDLNTAEQSQFLSKSKSQTNLNQQHHHQQQHQADVSMLTFHQLTSEDDIPIVFLTDLESSANLRRFLISCAKCDDNDNNTEIFMENAEQLDLAPNSHFKYYDQQTYELDWQIMKNEGSTKESVPFEKCNLLAKESLILENRDVQALCDHLPTFLVHGSRPAELLFATHSNGYHAPTLYRKMNEYEDGHNLIFVKTRSKNVFGALISANLRPKSGFYGTGESMLFSIKPTFKIYPWTGENEFFIHCDDSGFGVGSGSGFYGLWLNSCLRVGYTDRCSTYANDYLTADGEPTVRGIEFGVREVEVWTFSYLKDDSCEWEE